MIRKCLVSFLPYFCLGHYRSVLYVYSEEHCPISCLIALSIIYFAVTDENRVFTSFRAESLFSVPCLAASSPAFLPSVPTCALTHAILHFFKCLGCF